MAVAVDSPACYFKRFRMEIDLQHALPAAVLPPGYAFVPWEDSLLELHAEIKYQCFIDEMDTVVFPSLGCREGCAYLMREIRRKAGFQPGATWLVASPDGHCGTVQGIRELPGTGSIQNFGIIAGHRGRGLGTALLL